MHKTVSVQTRERTQLVDVTEHVGRVLREAGVRQGLCTVYCPHTTAAVTINEHADPDVVRDFLMEINKIVPFDDGYRHGEGNSAAHIKASVIGPSETIPVAGGRLQLGTWQGVYFCEFDGPRSRTLTVTIFGE